MLMRFELKIEGIARRVHHFPMVKIPSPQHNKQRYIKKPRDIGVSRGLDGVLTVPSVVPSWKKRTIDG